MDRGDADRGETVFDSLLTEPPDLPFVRIGFEKGMIDKGGGVYQDKKTRAESSNISAAHLNIVMNN